MKFILGVALAAEGVVTTVALIDAFALHGSFITWPLVLPGLFLLSPTAVAAGFVLAFEAARRR
jgi:hypothetical protein